MWCLFKNKKNICQREIYISSLPICVSPTKSCSRGKPSILRAAFCTCKTQICPATAVEQIVLLSHFNTQGIQLSYPIPLIKATVPPKRGKQLAWM